MEKCVVGEVRHSLYCVDHPPASSDLPYSMARVLGQASRYRQLHVMPSLVYMIY